MTIVVGEHHAADPGTGGFNRSAAAVAAGHDQKQAGAPHQGPVTGRTNLEECPGKKERRDRVVETVTAGSDR